MAAEQRGECVCSGGRRQPTSSVVRASWSGPREGAIGRMVTVGEEAVPRGGGEESVNTGVRSKIGSLGLLRKVREGRRPGGLKRSLDGLCGGAGGLRTGCTRQRVAAAGVAGAARVRERKPGGSRSGRGRRPMPWLGSAGAGPTAGMRQGRAARRQGPVPAPGRGGGLSVSVAAPKGSRRTGARAARP